MRTELVALLAPVVLLGGCRAAAPAQGRAGDFQVEATVSPDPPTTGDNRLLLRLRDAAGRPVDGASLDFLATMPAMGAMPEMRQGGEVQGLGDGAYRATFRLSMLGDWHILVRIQAPGHAPSELRLRVAPPRRGVSFVGAGETPVPDAGSGPAGAGRLLEVSAARQQLIGVGFGKAERRPLVLILRLPARVEVDETRIADVTLKYPAFIERLAVDQTGQAVQKGQPLLTLYSPELLAAEQDYLVARQAGDPGLVAAAEERLRLWDLSADQLLALVGRGRAESRVTLHSPVSGVVLMKSVVEGTRVEAGTPLYRIGNLGRVWVQADAFEMDAPHLAVDRPATMTLPSFPGVVWRGRVRFVAPTVDEKTRTVRARLEFENAQAMLRPGMLADVMVEVPLGDRLSIPDGALLRTGEHAYVFVRRGPGSLLPVAVEPGVRAGAFTEVLSGLEPGEEVALGATFLLSSEAQLRDALPRWGGR
ncbi:MAG TPA: efflux RND transporter periplasmic adaptor subunit [Myxococcaceae bacterium]|nr:efflux RND transporter periplasmic adaptor subunit [Myxococcaceae bacterium]